VSRLRELITELLRIDSECELQIPGGESLYLRGLMSRLREAVNDPEFLEYEEDGLVYAADTVSPGGWYVDDQSQV